MAKNVYRAGEIKFSETLIHISPPVLPKFKASGGFEEMTELPPPPVYTGPSPEEVEHELAEFRNRMDVERQQLSGQAKEEAERIVKEAEKVAFDEIQRKGAQAQETKNRADAEAQATIAAAQAKADELVADANKRVAEIEKDAYQHGLEQGKADGWLDGRAEAERLIERLHIIIARAIERRNEIMTESESQLVGLVLNIARKVVKVLTENQRNVVVNNVLQALRKLKSKTDVSIRVNIADLKVTTEHIKDITERIERVGNITVMEDATVDPGGCIIETDFGEIDARISSQFQEIEDKILEVTPIKTRAREVAEG